MVGSVMDGATQPEVEAVPLVAASCLNTSRLTGSSGLDSKGRAKRATWVPRHLVRDADAGMRRGRTASQISRVQYPLLYSLPRGSPKVTTLSNTIDNGQK